MRRIVTPSSIAIQSGGGLRVRAPKRYFSDGRVLVGSPKSDSAVMTYPDGSYLCGQFREGEAEGYCVYRDIAGRLIYTGYMENTQYQGWGAIWNETGEWPEHITFWCTSYPGNRVLRIKDPSGGKYQWVTYRGEDVGPMGEPMGEPMLMSADCRRVFQEARDIATGTIEFNEDQFTRVIQLHTDARVAADRSTMVPPSPHHGPRSSPFLMSPVPLSRSRRGEGDTVSSDDETSVRNPLAFFRVPPRIT